MKIRVILFAQLREELGFGEKEIELQNGGEEVECVVNKVLGKSAQNHARSSLKYAVNDEFVSSHHVLKDRDNLALIPPVSGG